MSAEMNPIERIRDLAKKDSRYRIEAYCYVFEALDFTLRRIGTHRHVSGRELCEGIRDLAIEKFGPLAKTVFAHWGITRTEDFGTIVFNLVDAGLMGKTDTDSIEDFRSVYDFDDVFERNLRLHVSLDGR
jgi:uncharacterized repeat protein (TIGR04138 family)